MKQALSLVVLLGSVGCGDTEPTPRARLVDQDGRVQLELARGVRLLTPGRPSPARPPREERGPPPSFP